MISLFKEIFFLYLFYLNNADSLTSVHFPVCTLLVALTDVYTFDIVLSQYW